MKSLFILIILFAIFCGCGLLLNDPEWIEEKSYTIEAELPPDARTVEPIVFTVKSSLPNSCWNFSRLRIASSGFDVYVTPYKKRLIKETICADVITGVVEDGQFTPVFPGEYRFHFWRPDTLTLEYIVVVR